MTKSYDSIKESGTSKLNILPDYDFLALATVIFGVPFPIIISIMSISTIGLNSNVIYMLVSNLSIYVCVLGYLVISNHYRPNLIYTFSFIIMSLMLSQVCVVYYLHDSIWFNLMTLITMGMGGALGIAYILIAGTLSDR